MKPDTFLITGGAGNLACQLSQLLEQRGGRVVLFDVATGPIAPAASDAVYIQGDVRDAETLSRLFAEHEPSVVIHLASLLSASTEADRNAGWQINVDGGLRVFEASLQHRVRQVFFPSSVAAYGGALPSLLPEDFPQWPDGLYGVSKVAVERLGHYYHVKHGLDFRCLRLPVVVSPFAPEGAASAYASQAFIEGVRRGEFTFRVREQTRPSMAYVKDVLRAILMLLDAPAGALTRRAYNIQAISPTAEAIGEAIRRRIPGCRIEFAPDPDVANLIESWPMEFEDASARRDWNWHPQYDLSAMAGDFIRDLEEHQPAAGVDEPGERRR